MEDVAVEQDSEQKIMVFQVQYMVAVAEAVKNWIGTKLMSKAETRKDLEAGLEKMLKERRQRLKRYKNAQKKALAAGAAAAAAPPGPPPQQVAAAAPATLAEVAGADGGAIAMQQQEEKGTAPLPWTKRVGKEPHERWETFAEGYDASNAFFGNTVRYRLIDVAQYS